MHGLAGGRRRRLLVRPAVGSPAEALCKRAAGAFANFVGQWAPSLLIIGVYDELAKEIAIPRYAA